MILSRQCLCGQKVEFEAEELSQLNCPTCGSSLHKQFAPAPLPRPTFEPPPEPIQEEPRIAQATPPAENDRLVTLQAVRRDSCYKTLRGLIETTIGVGLVIIIFAAIASLSGAVMNQTRPEIAGAAVALLVICAICAVLLVALKQALLLGIDAVDVLIAERASRLAEQNARRKLAVDEFTATVDK